MSLIGPAPKLDLSGDSSETFYSTMIRIGQMPQLQLLLHKANDQYFYWTDVAHRMPVDAGVKAEQIWAYIKLGRFANRKSSPVRDKANVPFTYWIPDCLHRSVSEVDRLSGGQLISDQPFSLPSREKFIISSLMDEAIASSQLEGASTEYKVAKEMLRQGRKPKDKHEQMIFNNWNAMQFIRENYKRPFSLGSLFELHSLLTLETLVSPDDAGKFRQTDDVFVRYRDEIVHIPPKAAVLHERINRLIEFANSDDEENWIHPVIKGAMIHFWLAYDHPFVDGNGRTARALMYWYLLSRGYEFFQYLSISKHFLRAPGKYVRAYLYTENDENDLTYFLVYNLLAVRFALNELRKYFQHKKEEISRANELLAKSRGLNLRQKSLLYHAIQHPETAYTIEAHKNTHGIAYDTARRDLMMLVSKGFLRSEKEGKRLFIFFPTNKAFETMRQS